MSYVFTLSPGTILFWGHINYFILLRDEHTHFQVNLIGYCLIFCIVTFLVLLRNKKVQIVPVF